ncbi:KTSC domain-containing protein [Paenibacillus polymyxa]|uniref:KTSC domain-containing protein n=1 Tax=Paenibacillus polymyxa TaxID=1406 RepID=UPI0003D2FD76|nr:KTSC domain-containing protein [Paenibacillus polymyxa]AHC18884.1 KTSC domain containing protein [Paenibacillus polymyxa CR1]
MQWVSVTSSNISSIAYDGESSTLYVKFNNGSQYAYNNVPASVHSGLMNATSHGSYLASHVKGNYPYRRL